jgi:hypothetical protein
MKIILKKNKLIALVIIVFKVKCIIHKLKKKIKKMK